MKNIFYLILSVLFLGSCSEGIPYEDVVVEKLRQEMKNPHAFIVDSVVYTPYTYSKSLLQRSRYDSIMIEINHESIVKREEMIVEYAYLDYSNSFISEYRGYINDYKKQNDSLSKDIDYIKSEIQRVQGTDLDTLMSHEYRVYYMGQNSFGAMIKDIAYITASLDGKKIQIETRVD